MKRLKSFLITASSVLGTAFFAVVLTPEWASFLLLLKDKLLEWGVPLTVVALIGVFVSEVWKAILNYRTLSKYKDVGLASAFSDRNNELY